MENREPPTPDVPLTGPESNESSVSAPQQAGAKASILEGNCRHHPMMLPIFTILMLLLTVFSIRELFRPEASVAPSSIPTQPVLQTVPAEPAVQTDCFRVTDGVLEFLAPEFEPSPILVVPETVDGVPVRVIGPDTFAGCDGVTTILLPEGLEQISERAFANLRHLRGICLPTSCRSIGAEAFRGCSALEAVYVPLEIRQIGPDAFAGCASVHYIFYSGFHSDWQKLCSEFITPFTYVLCLDGRFPQIPAPDSE